MEEKTLDELKQEADELGISYSPNIGKAKLAAKIEEAKANGSEDDEDTSEEEVVEVKPAKVEKKVKEDPRVAAIRKIRQQEAANRKTEIVKITMVDKREASTATHAYFNSGNVAMNVPLDVWVEMPRILIKQAEESKGLTHVESNGVTIPKLTKRYVVDYRR